MSLKLRILSGPLEGQKFSLKSGQEALIGRQDADIVLNDPRVSSAHAFIREVNGRWVVVDNGSKNGIRNSDGQPSPQIRLKAGKVFQIGMSKFEVVAVESPEAPKARPAQPAPPQAAKVRDVSPAPPEKKAEEPQPQAPKARRWHEILGEFMQQHADQIRDQVRPAPQALNPAVVLDFVRGAQASSKWILGYGPRQIGAASMDLPIFEPEAPSVCFELHPSPEGILFKTAHAAVVKLNGRTVDSQLLRMGDTIQIMETLIEVDFTE